MKFTDPLVKAKKSSTVLHYIMAVLLVWALHSGFLHLML